MQCLHCYFFGGRPVFTGSRRRSKSSNCGLVKAVSAANPARSNSLFFTFRPSSRARCFNTATCRYSPAGIVKVSRTTLFFLADDFFLCFASRGLSSTSDAGGLSLDSTGLAVAGGVLTAGLTTTGLVTAAELAAGAGLAAVTGLVAAAGLRGAAVLVAVAGFAAVAGLRAAAGLVAATGLAGVAGLPAVAGLAGVTGLPAAAGLAAVSGVVGARFGLVVTVIQHPFSQNNY